MARPRSRHRDDLLPPGQGLALELVLKEALRNLDLGTDTARILRAAKQFAAFSGAMRASLIAEFDCIGVLKLLGIGSCSELFGSGADLVQTTSVLRNPGFFRGGN